MTSNILKQPLNRPLIASKWSKPLKFLYSLLKFLIAHFLIPHTLWSKILSKTVSNSLKRPLIASKRSKPLKFLYAFKHFCYASFDTPHSLIKDTFKNSLKFSLTASNFLKRPLVASKWSKPPIFLYSLLTFLIAHLLIPHTLMIKDTFKNGLYFF